jgi:hypothetical protein
MPLLKRTLSCDESERSGVRCSSVYTLDEPAEDDAVRTRALLAGWSSDGEHDRCAFHTHTLGALGGAEVPVEVQGPDAEPHDLLRQPWRLIYEHEIRRLFPWARAPYATITTHEGRFVVYSDRDSPDVAVARFDAEPHRGLYVTTVYRREPADVTLDVAILAATERKIRCSFVTDAD